MVGSLGRIGTRQDVDSLISGAEAGRSWVSRGSAALLWEFQGLCSSAAGLAGAARRWSASR